METSKVIIITGTSSGVGLALGNYFAEKNYKVYGFSRTIPENANFQTIITDITQKEQVTEAVKKVIEKENRVDYLINNAGRGMVGAVENATEKEICELFSLNLIACVHLFAEILPIMQKQNSGKIINISSIGSEMGLPFRGMYSASKAALDKITEAMRYELLPSKIQVTSLHLGDVQTDIAQSRIKSNISNYYQNTFQKVFANIDNHVDKGISAETIAPFIEKLLQKSILKPHYYFGKFGQKIGVTLKKILPQLWFESMMKKYADL